MKNFKRNRLARAISLALAGSAVAAMAASPVLAQDAMLDEIIVTAAKREQNLQDVPVSIQVLNNQQLENLNVRSFEDYIDMLPTVSYDSSGPGYAKIYMRGIASGGDGNHSASMPSVGFYLDEQPVTTINQILDIHMYDIARVETLSGPQGTLYGQGSQSGTIRIITNKPVMGRSEFGYDIEGNTIDDGGTGYNLNGFGNIPIGERAAVRLVAWTKETAGFIDLVPATMDFPGGTPIGPGLPGPGSLPTSTDNFAFARKDYNTVRTSGLRALLKVDLNDNWSVTPGIIYQDSKIEGTWAHNPEDQGDLQSGAMWDAFADDEWYQATLTLEGSIGDIDLVYAGAYLDRENISEYDYSDYTEYWATYSQYTSGGTWCVYYSDRPIPMTDPVEYECAVGTQYVGGFEQYKRQSHEFRLQSSADNSLRWIAGAFFQAQEHNFDLQWIVPDLDTNLTVVESPTGDRKFGGNTVWQTYQVRDDEDSAFFGELTYDFTDNLTATAGARYFEYENSLYGFNGFVRHCTGQYVNDVFVVMTAADGGEVQYPCFDTRILDDVAKGDDWAFKINAEYSLGDDKMIYVTWSEGFRAGGVNRARVPDIPKYDPDFVTNYEFGWKLLLADGRLRFNGAAYIIDWDNFQFGFLDFTVSNLTIVQNVGNSQTKGLEWDLTFAANDNNELTFAGSYNDAELETDFWRTDDDRVAGLPANAPAGTPMPYVPELQLTGIWRSEFELGSMPSFFQAAVSYTGKRWNDLDTTNVPARREMDAYTLVNLSAGIQRDNWSVGLFINNAFDERAEIDISDPGYGTGIPGYVPPGTAWTTMTNRPRSYSIRFSQRF
ncbi:MAG: TonB-dependent receptor [Proteobacteria bacterium]|nr:TonB-dependent receptor [Pseudomonadota bacterium]